MRRALLVLALLIGACDEGFDPYSEGGAAFALDGTLRAGADTQRVRVQPLRRQEDGAATLAFTLRSEGPDGTREWENALVAGDAGQPIAVSSAALRLRPGADYRLVATNERGTTTAHVVVPDSFALDVLATAVAPDTAFVRQSLRLIGAPDAVREVTVEYVVRASADAEPVPYARTYPTRTTVDGRVWTVELAEDLLAARRAAGVGTREAIVIASTAVRYRQRAAGSIGNGFGAVDVEAEYRAPWAVAEPLLPFLRATTP